MKISKNRNQTRKVLFLSSLFPSKESPTRGIFIKDQIREINKLARVVGIISPYACTPRLTKLSEQRAGIGSPTQEDWVGTTIYRPRYFAVPKVTVYLNGFLYSAAVYKLIKGKQSLKNCDLIHAHFSYPDGLAAVLMAKTFSKRIILTVRGSDINYFPQDPILKLFIKYTLKNVNHVISVSESLKNKVSRLQIKPHKVSVIPNGVNLRVFKPLPKDSVRKDLGLREECKVILYVGSLEKVKGVTYLIRAFKEFASTSLGRNSLLVLIGTGALENNIKRMISDCAIGEQFVVKNHVPHNQIPVWMNACDVLCLPSINEGRPNVLYEAIACGIPVVATNVGGVKEIIVSEDLGELIEPRCVASIKAALASVVNRRWNSELIRSYALPHRAGFYAKQVVDLYGQVASKRFQ